MRYITYWLPSIINWSSSIRSWSFITKYAQNVGRYWYYCEEHHQITLLDYIAKGAFLKYITTLEANFNLLVNLITIIVKNIERVGLIYVHASCVYMSLVLSQVYALISIQTIWIMHQSLQKANIRIIITQTLLLFKI